MFFAHSLYFRHTPVDETQISHRFAYYWANIPNNEVKILGLKQKVDLLPITSVADLNRLPWDQSNNVMLWKLAIFGKFVLFVPLANIEWLDI